MTAIISAILVGILKSIGWQNLIIKVGVDLLHYAAGKAKNDAIHNTINDIADALQKTESG